MELLNPADLVKALPVLRYPGGAWLALMLHRIMKLDRINNLYGPINELPANKFIDSLIAKLGFQINVSREEIQNIPCNGPFITISNHAYGGIDGIILFKLLFSKRPDFKILMNFLLAKVKPIEGFALKVNPFEKVPNVQSSYSGLKEALHHLKNGHPVGLFPAGEVASFKIKTGTVTDKNWPPSVLKLILKARVPVIPIYFEGHNSLLFQILGMVNPIVRTALLPSEMLNKSGKKIRVRIGRPITVREQEKLTDINDFGRYLRMRTFSLGIQTEKQKKSGIFQVRHQEPLVQAVPTELLVNEVEGLKSSCLLFSFNNHRVFCTPATGIPFIMQELGRLREITYREVGEGTNKSIDLDAFDHYYHHLFIWDNLEKRIIGGYRVGFGNRIMETHGVHGFYISTLFHIRKGVKPVLNASMELGRSFIIKSWQKKPLSLFLLWKGIFVLLCRHPDLRYMIGPVSISNTYSNPAKALMVSFLKKNHFNKELSVFFIPRKKFVHKIPPTIRKKLFYKVTGKNLGKVENFIQSFDPGFRTPVLLKKYLGINSEIIGFNVDPLFSNCLDVLIITDILEIPEEMIRSLSKELTDNNVTERFVSIKPFMYD